ncbi:MAG: RNA polymerase sigma factor FliA [Pseudomonadales bacterium]
MYPARQPNDARTVEAHLDLVRRIAHHLMARLPPSVQVDDLIQAGAIGLMGAIRDYQEGHGASFTTYAGIRIRGAMLDEIRRQDWAPRSSFRDARRISDAIHAVESRTGREATDRQVAAELGVAADDYQKLLQKVTETRLLSLEASLESGDQGLQPVAVEDDDPLAACLQSGFGDALAEAVNGLPERERLVLALYYDEELNLKEIGAVIGVTESRVCQIHGQALARLKARLGDWYTAD